METPASSRFKPGEGDWICGDDKYVVVKILLKLFLFGEIPRVGFWIGAIMWLCIS